MVYIEGMRKLTEVSRSRKNMDKVLDAIADVENDRDTLESWAESVNELRDNLSAFAEKTRELDSDYFDDGVQEKLLDAVAALEPFLPEEDSTVLVIAEKFDEVKEGLEELESQLEDREYSAAERDGQWESIQEALGVLVEGLDGMSVIGPTTTQAEANP
ncbi:hypothetical protein [Streptomyces sp. NPDC017448]|uniref:hypothetical protein n=1 Tax=Streptomyces sp. NPDC017448 TaxID=3364996 RepID=UPI00379694E2